MTAGTPRLPDADALARAAEAFVLVWSSTPPDLPEKISASQLRALITVRRSAVTTVTALARDLGALPSSATRLCDRLVAAGYLDRAPDAANRRFHAVRLTPAGERLLSVLDAHRRRALAAVLDRMDDAVRQGLLVGLAEFGTWAAATSADASTSAEVDPTSAELDPRSTELDESRATAHPA
jgi:DNA-binding MarR family transcriptional regulator